MSANDCFAARASVRRAIGQTETALAGVGGERRAALLALLKWLRQSEDVLTAEMGAQAREALTGQGEAVT